MAVISMKKVTLIGMQRERERIIKSIQSMGNLEISQITDDKAEGDEPEALILDGDIDTLEAIQSQLSEIEFTLGLLDQYNPKKKGMFDTKPKVSVRELYKALDSRDEILKISKECNRLDGKLSELALEKNKLINTIEKMEPWVKLDIPLDEISDTSTTRAFAGTANKGGAQKLIETIRDIEGDLAQIWELGDIGEDTCFFVIYHRSAEKEIQEILKEFIFSKSSFSGFSGTPYEIILNARKQLDRIDKSREDTAQRLAEFAGMRPKLELLYDGLLIEQDRQAAILNLKKTHHTFALTGWIPAREAEAFTRKLQGEFEELYIDLRDPAPEEEFPVELDNPAVITPFEMVTNLYSSPNPRELDPNTIMAPFYALFFGFMMGDAGYGLIMALGTYFFLNKMSPKGDTKKLIGVIFYGSIFTFIWGAIFGGWFGNAGELFGISPLWFSPSEEPIKMLVVCFALGIIHVFAGIGVKAYINIREGRILDAVFDQGFWYVFYTGLILWLAGGMAGLGSAYSQTGKIMTIAGAAGLVLTQGRDKKNIFSKFFSGLLSLYDVTGFLSDILSYSRLFALALTTGVIGTVINQLGAMAGGTWYGWILAALILIGGHTFNIAINILGAFVHTSRLQYIEFYGKFYEGGGKLFKPLGLKTKYMDISK
ncbi:MAG: V-type ATP synthase subunit I [Clostridiales bacterium]|nr:V-type ATP synthase subunit I [Clostridiales bacterium]